MLGFMYIQWYGQTCFKIQAKTINEEVQLVTDPIAESSGAKLSRLYADIVTISSLNNPLIDFQVCNGTANSPEPFLITGAGEYEIKGVFVTGSHLSSENSQDSTVIYRYDIEDIRLVHLGLLHQKKLTDQQIEILGDIDVLMVPVGGGESLQVEEAISLITVLEPRVVIPMYYSVDGVNESLSTIESFTQEFGAGVMTPEKKIRLIKKDLPQDNTQLYILEKS